MKSRLVLGISLVTIGLVVILYNDPVTLTIFASPTGHGGPPSSGSVSHGASGHGTELVDAETYTIVGIMLCAAGLTLAGIEATTESKKENTKVV